MSYDINRIILILYAIGGILLLIGAAWFYTKGDYAGMIINLIAAVLILVAAYFRFKG